MIQTRNITPSLIEIYTDGGGYITESYPTHFHTFATARPLAAGETVADFREVTAAERQRLEEADAAFVRPPQLFIDEWNDNCALGFAPNGIPLKERAGMYNETTGYFELNGFKDIDYDEAREILRLHMRAGQSYPGYGNLQRQKVRTIFPIRKNDYYGHFGVNFSQVGVHGLKKIVFAGQRNWTEWIPFDVIELGNSLVNRELEEIATELSPLDVQRMSHWNGLYDAMSLREIRLRGLGFDLLMAKCANISLVSLQYILQYAKTIAKGFTITVHPDVYAKLTDEANTEWHALIAAAEAKNIVFATP